MTKNAKTKVLKKRVFAQDERGITSMVVSIEERYAGQYTSREFRSRFNHIVSDAHDALRRRYDVTEIRICKV